MEGDGLRTFSRETDVHQNKHNTFTRHYKWLIFNL